MPFIGSMGPGTILAFVDCEIDASAGAGGGSGRVECPGRVECSAGHAAGPRAILQPGQVSIFNRPGFAETFGGARGG